MERVQIAGDEPVQTTDADLPQGTVEQIQDGRTVRTSVKADQRSLPPLTPQGQEQASGASGGPATGTSPERPPWLPEKFKSPQELAQAYQALEQKLGSQGGGQQQQGAQDPGGGKELLSQEEQEAILGHYAANGTFLPEHQQLMEQRGITRQIQDTWARGQVALAHEQMRPLFDAAGGREQYESLSDWLTKTLPQGEVASLRKQVTDSLHAGDVDGTVALIKGLRARMEQQVGGRLEMLQGDIAGGTGGAKPFGSMKEMMDAQRTAAYLADDPAEHRRFMARMQATQAAGVQW